MLECYCFVGHLWVLFIYIYLLTVTIGKRAEIVQSNMKLMGNIELCLEHLPTHSLNEATVIN